MENIMPNMVECYHSVVAGLATPRFTMTEDEATQVLTACEKAGIRGILLDKVKTLACFSAAKNRFAGRISIVEMK